MAEDIEPISFANEDVLACPYDAYETLLADAPVYKDPGTGSYIVSRYEDVRAILLDPKRFSSEGYLNAITDTVLAERAERMRALYRERGWLPDPALGFIDDPRHRDIRAVFERAFRAGRIKAMEPQIRDIAYQLADRLATLGSCDFVAEFAVPLPLHVTGLITGVPTEDLEKIRIWTDAFIRRFGLMISEEEERECVLLEIEAQHYLRALIERLRATPEDSLLSDLVNTPLSDGTTLSDNALLAHLMADTFVGGSETTTSALASGLRLLCQHPGLYAKVRADPDTLLRPFIEEVLRLESPVQGLYRVATEDVVLHGQTIPAASVINLRYAAANRDDRHFGCPAALDVERRNSGSHLAFGSGIHHCVGATLARRELYWGFRSILERCGPITLAEANDFSHAPSLMLRRLAALHIEL